MPFDFKQPAYIRLRDILTERTNSVVAWTGAGMSADADVPTWPALRLRLEKAALAKVDSYEGKDRLTFTERLEQTRKETNLWIAFDRLYRLLLKTTFENEVKSALSVAVTKQPPLPMAQLLKLRIRGVVTLNLDRLVEKAFAQAKPDVQPILFRGRDAANTDLTSPVAPFIGYLHGQIEDTSSWVFTSRELSRMLRDQAYGQFLRTLLCSNTVLFVGISTDDAAVGSHLDYLKDLNYYHGPHFWITDRRDRATDAWASERRIEVIRYDSSAGHSPLSEALADLGSFVPTVEPVPSDPVIYSDATSNELPDYTIDDLKLLAATDRDQLREVLNARASAVLSRSGSDGEYERFRTEYAELIHDALFVSTAPGRNKLLGYELEETERDGAFGRIYRARSPAGEQVAIKLLRQNLLEERDLWSSFRRGVRTMEILSKRAVNAAVKYERAAEIPPFVAMEWIEGPDLDDAVMAGHVSDWTTRLRVATELATILHQAHSLPERVLHRDLRPPNIKLENFYSDPEWRVRVLDFDLSWHVGTTDKSVTHGATQYGYLAPEQTQAMPGVSTRNAAVDAFGLGMLLWFMLSKKHPRSNQQRWTEWRGAIRDEVARNRCSEWRSLPARYGRLIFDATRDNQSERLDVPQMLRELRRLQSSQLDPSMTTSAELIAEELAASSASLSDYSWDPNRGEVIVTHETGIRVILNGREASKSIAFTGSWTAQGFEDQRIVQGKVRRMQTAITEILQSAGWKVYWRRASADHSEFTAEKDASLVLGSLNQESSRIDQILTELSRLQ